MGEHQVTLDGGGGRLPTHHIGEELLLDYAAGATTEAVSLLIASHLALCPMCRGQLAELEQVGGALLGALPGEEPDDAGLEAILARLDEDDEEPTTPVVSMAAPVVAPEAGDGILLPEPLRSYVGTDLGRLGWKRRMRGLDECVLPVGGARVSLMRIHQGAAMPKHTHAGNELTLVLTGGFTDARGSYLRGDVAVTDQHVDHQPVADLDEDCLCLAVVDAPLRLTGRVTRFLNPFLRI